MNTNKILHKVGKTTTPLFSFCGWSDESLGHLFSCCEFVCSFWLRFPIWHGYNGFFELCVIFQPALAHQQSFPEYSEKLKASHLRIKMHLSITVAWFVLAFLSLSKVAQQFSEVSTSSYECPYIYIYLRLFRKQK